MLLSFAQFEREVTAERIRDKIAASKAKGMWMGGVPPLGYRPDGRSLAIVEEHAALVRDIFARYLQVGNVRRVANALAADGVRRPLRTTSGGRSYGGGPFTRGPLYHMLRNATYAGRIPHRDKCYPGNHPPIIDPATFDQVQQMLTDNTAGEERARLPHRSLLAGLITDTQGEPMQASHASRKGVRYRYYVSREARPGENRKGLRLPAREIELLVKEQVAALFDDPLLLAAKLGIAVSPALLGDLNARCQELAAALRSRTSGQLSELVTKVRASEAVLEIDVSPAAIAAALQVAAPEDAPKDGAPALTLRADYRLTRTGRAVRLIDSDGRLARSGEPSTALVSMVVEARRLWSRLSQGDIDISTLAKETGRNDSYITRLVRIAFLSPQVIDAILDGRQHGALTGRMLRDPGGIAVSWEEQAVQFLPSTHTAVNA
ncbi:MAG: recombinase family protein [Proteobacteria bacterium]|nr:MAG: recombinase family protein [Pseudomonadota bacterium]